MHNIKTLVVGTTPDYIDYLRKKNPGKLFFLTDRQLRYRAHESRPGSDEELLCDLNNPDESRQNLLDYLHENRLEADGIVCFDCEALPLSALLARDLGLPYPSPEAIRNCRDKHLSKTLWQRFGIRCPQARLLQSKKDVDGLSKANCNTWVLKPSCGSGSELVYLSHNHEETKNSFKTIQSQLKSRSNQSLYRDPDGEPAAIIAEELVSGTEYSADFILTQTGVEIVRLTEKIKQPDAPFGTIRGYFLRSTLGRRELDENLRRTLSGGARALGLEKALCMADFIIQNDEIFLLEITPRPGGDCLPALLLAAGPLDILTLALDCARGHWKLRKGSGELPEKQLKPLAALRFHAGQEGIIKNIDNSRLLSDGRTIDCQMRHKTGDRISMPPEDYDSWQLGYLIFAPDADQDIATQCQQLSEKMIIEIEA